MGYTRSFPLTRWLTDRRASIDTLAQAHAQIGELGSRGRPLEVGRPVAHAYIIRVVAEVQAFARDLHDLGAELLVTSAAPLPGFNALLVSAATEGRQMDRGNADLRTLQSDFRRLGIQGLSGKLDAINPYWASSDNPPRRGDRAFYGDLIQLRNALAHGNQADLDRLRREGVLDTVTWGRARLAGLNRTAKALDRVLWDHLRATFGADPW